MNANILPLKSRDHADWSDWRWQIQHRIQSVEELSSYIDFTDD